MNAEGIPLGRLASKVAYVLQGKHKPIYTKHINVGDVVVVTNIAKVMMTGKKWEQKKYTYHSGYPGGLKVRNGHILRNLYAANSN